MIFTSFTRLTSFNTKIDMKYFLSRFVLAYYFPIFLCGTFEPSKKTVPLHDVAVQRQVHASEVYYTFAQQKKTWKS